ncbi:serpin peptidase inhibitor, clade A (alpha-1 antiproteinase, antitrypsin), member 10a [Megalops cyprinoides]|uniref:serpin peptidase inhibitor, clade A (alpha-1 antiproteinase, antitrypsin), member 10a n=1 Tax=Megalops cyprinoides TaxID=118141 RepID=UPI00186562CF|nr:serpin peptidase inhibitor, clade A (alpha-1 antiproteinase, antitrypsin), member 10a [Megalops cyprinoides]
MKTAILFLLARASFLATISRAQQPVSDDVAELAAKNTEFAASLYRKVASASDDNILLSPLSVSVGLAALSAGAGGATREQLLQGLGLAPLERNGQPERLPQLFQKLQEEVTRSEGLRLYQATALFLRQQAEVVTSFSELVKKFYGADVTKADFGNAQAAKNTINDYVNSKTGGRVAEAVSSLDPTIQLMLVSSVFAQGTWELPFNRSATQEERFYVNKYKVVQVPMMIRADKYYLAYDPSIKLGVLKLPYQGGVAMLVLLPDKDVDYTSIDEMLTAERFLGWVGKLKKTKLEVQLPRFSLEQSYGMRNILPDLGITDVFENTANLTLSSESGLKLSEVLHKVMIDVSERGTGTTSGLGGSSMPPRLTINRPFLFIIYHEATKSPLFMGRVIDPTKK